ncbi:hypothetical protein L9F63_022839, partial [Diploptera punctata]
RGLRGLKFPDVSPETASGIVKGCYICLLIVVLQYYEVQVYYNKNVIRGNTAVLKCTIPSFVREYITVTSWVQDSKFNIYPSIKG